MNSYLERLTMPRKLISLSAAPLFYLLTACADTAVKPQTSAETPAEALPAISLDFPFVTHHRGVFNGRTVDYTASVDALNVNDAEGRPGARIVSISYVVEPDGQPDSRPVMFVFNGGPISPSVYLHMGAFGPKRVEFSDDLSADPKTAPLVDNPYSILDVTDLVYFDPAGTGFSRVLPGKSPEDYFSVEADAQQTAAFIASWLEANGRSGSPTYLFGESYGTNRAAETARQLAELPEPVFLDGVVLFGQAVNIIEYAQRPHNIISYVVSLPTLAALAWYHGKAGDQEARLQDFVDASWAYAQTDYLDALFQGNTLPADQLQLVADQLEYFTGLRSEFFVENQLRVSKETYRSELFRDEGLVIGRSDGRYLARVVEGEATPDPSGGLPAALQEAFPGYLSGELGVTSTEGYLFDSPVKSLDGWGWGGQSPFARFDYGAGLTVLLEKHPETRVLVTAGYYDTMTTTGASIYYVEQETWPGAPAELKFYVGGHMAYSDENSAREMAQDLRAMISSSK